MFLLPKNDKMVTRFGNKTFRLLLFVKFNTKIFSFPMVLCKKVYLCNII